MIKINSAPIEPNHFKPTTIRAYPYKKRSIRRMIADSYVKDLQAAGYQSWKIHLTRFSLMNLVIMLCNKCCPENAYLAYWAVKAEKYITEHSSETAKEREMLEEMRKIAQKVRTSIPASTSEGS